jgi:putative ubiquitin-RnfH superfamily antitoxin RatB of RatAB toxin-antitoxin module
MGSPADKTCVVVFALPERQWQWSVRLPPGGTVGDALGLAREQAADVDVPWDSAEVGVFGEICDRSIQPRDGDRIEIYRPLKSDPKESRRARAAARRAAADRASSPPRSAAKPVR